MNLKKIKIFKYQNKQLGKYVMDDRRVRKVNRKCMYSEHTWLGKVKKKMSQLSKIDILW